MSDLISRHLGMTPMTDDEVYGDLSILSQDDDDEDEDDDSTALVIPEGPMDATQTQEFVEESIRSMMSKSTKAVGQIAKLAKMSDSPRAYEVLANMIKTTVDAGKTLIDINRSKVLPGGEGSGSIHTGDVIHNNLTIKAGSDEVDDVVERLALAMKKDSRR